MFLDDNFLLTNKWAVDLFHQYAKEEPIIDYHCHLEAKTIFENPQYENLTQLWLNDKGAGDHYKWRLMRANGVPEELISGDGDDYEKFLAFVRTLEKAFGNPIYEWSHLELRRYFDIDLIISEANAPEIWCRANEKINSHSYRPQELLRKMKVKAVCTTDDPVDDLAYHIRLKEMNSDIAVLPTFRPDMSWSISNVNFSAYIKKLGTVSQINIQSFSDLVKALTQRVEFFHSVGGRLADQGLNSYHYAASTMEELDYLLQQAMNGQNEFDSISEAKFSTAIQLELMKVYTRLDWTMQMHMNCLRDASTRMKRELGINVGGDAMGDQTRLAYEVRQLFAVAEESDYLPKVILYSLNPGDWMPLATMMQSFQGGMNQRLQLGCAWWFNDTYDGMKQQLTVMAQQSLLANFTGMLTDSRSFLSYPRHEYFRRILCQLLGEWIEQGRIPNELAIVGPIVQRIAYGNASEYFGFAISKD
ncbi:glucuronate isomerase [Veillonella sp.]|uniref:glucuronate isomerase n=1 Tax=Veillonella sp. TaxID=1926307 RepID=UPI0025FC8BCA|nr:glucuronate isomerase [Veillonella sp.]